MSIDVRRWAREGYLAPNSYCKWRWADAGEKGSTIGVRVGEGRLFLLYSYPGWGEREYPIRLAWTDCHFGGSRVWFLCPRCNRRAAKLFLSGGRFACWDCHQLAYLSQSDTAFDAFHRRIGKIKGKLGGDDQYWKRPRGMHQATYERLRKKLAETESRLYGFMPPATLKLCKRLGCAPNATTPSSKKQ